MICHVLFLLTYDMDFKIKKPVALSKFGIEGPSSLWECARGPKCVLGRTGYHGNAGTAFGHTEMPNSCFMTEGLSHGIG